NNLFFLRYSREELEIQRKKQPFHLQKLSLLLLPLYSRLGPTEQKQHLFSVSDKYPPEKPIQALGSGRIDMGGPNHLI
uniref:Factor interacting with PAPOLA and CPSF1 n=1 Tax=Macaca fascicularis TaxID=9541 RepID=A0A2K5W241_MACFA